MLSIKELAKLLIQAVMALDAVTLKKSPGEKFRTVNTIEVIGVL